MRAGLWVLAMIVAACLLAPTYAALVSGTDPFRTDVMGQVAGQDVLAEAPGGLGTVPVGPGWRGAYALGGDRLGRDVAARLLYGGRTSLLVAGGATVLCLALGTLGGVAAGVGAGWVRGGAGAAIDLVWAFPVTLLAIALALGLGGVRAGPLMPTLMPMVILGVVYAPYVARPVRAALVGLRGAEFVEAARAVGCGPARILLRHLLPQLRPLLLGLVPVVAAMTLLTEASLSVLGVGIAAPGVSWGTLIGDGIGLMHQRPLVAVAPGLVLSVTVLALNAVGEGLGASG